jgi:predicted acetyltransferase
MSPVYEPLRESDVASVTETLGWSFNFPVADAEPWLRKAGYENVRVLRDAERVVACLVLIPMGQFFGGKSIPMMGIAGVATAPDARGEGAAVQIMQEALAEIAARGFPLSALYPASLALYRRLGYEVAGARYEVKVPLSSITVRDRALPLRAMRPSDHESVHAAYCAHAAHAPGHLDRGAYVWDRVHQPRGHATRGFVVGEPGHVDGYVVLYEKNTPEALHYSLHVTDMAARTPAALRRILTFFADHGTLADTVVWYGSPADAFTHAITTVELAVRVQHAWMLRLVDVPKALAARGYPPGVTAHIELAMEDDRLPANEGRVILHVSGGRAEVSPGGGGTIRLHARTLAALFSGHASIPMLAASGLVEGPPEAVSRLAAAFAGSAPWMPDFF